MNVKRPSKRCKRRFTRHQMLRTARFRFHNEGAQDGLITDVSDGGMFLKLTQTVKAVHMKPRQRSRLIIALPLQNHILKFFGQVTRHTAGGLGVKFINCDPSKIAMAVKMLREAPASPNQTVSTQHGTQIPAEHQVTGSRPKVSTHHLSYDPHAYDPHGSTGHITTPTASSGQPERQPGAPLRSRNTRTAQLSATEAQQLSRRLNETVEQVFSSRLTLTLRGATQDISTKADNCGRIFGGTGEWSNDLTIIKANLKRTADTFRTATLQSLKYYLRGQATIEPTPSSSATVHAPPTQFSQLALMSDKEVKSTVLQTSVANAEDRVCEGALLELSLRLSDLLGISDGATIPIRPTLITARFVSAVEALGVSEGAFDIFMKHFNKHFINRMAEVYEELNVTVINAGGRAKLSDDPRWQQRMRGSIQSKYEAAERQTGKQPKQTASRRQPPSQHPFASC